MVDAPPMSLMENLLGEFPVELASEIFGFLI
jgi:hypothetical protein